MMTVVAFLPLLVMGIILVVQHKAKLEGRDKAEYQHMQEVVKGVEQANKALLNFRHDRYKRDQLLNKYSRSE